MEDREALLRQDGFLLGIATLGLVNGMQFSPWYEGAFILLRPLLTSFYITSPLITLYFSSLVLAVGSTLLAGVPAALYERATGRTQSDARSMTIWLGCAFLIALPALGRMIGAW